MSQLPEEPRPNEDEYYDMREIDPEKTPAEIVGGYVKRTAVNSAKHTFRGAIASFLLSFTFTNEWDKRRLRNRLAAGGSVGPWEFLFGSPFSVWGLLKTVVFLAAAGGVAYYLWDQGFFAMLMEQQAILDNISATATATAP